jgi:lipopolysaccharide export system permease protein
MDGGHIVRRMEGEAAPQIVAFDRYVFDLNQLEQRGEQIEIRRPRERDTYELIAPDPDDPVFKLSPGSFTSELHERLASPLYAFTFVLIVLALMGQAQTTRQNRVNSVVGAFGVALGCRIVGIAEANSVVVHPNLHAILYAVPLAAGLVALFTIARRLYPRPPSRAVRALGRFGAAAVERLKQVTAPARLKAGASPARLARRGS